MFTKDACMGCKATVKFLTKRSIPFETRSVADLDPEIRARHLQAPVVIAPDGRDWSGFNPTLLKELITPHHSR